MAAPEYYRDADASRAEMLRVLDGMVASGRITSDESAVARADIEAAYATADTASWFGVDAETFWTDLGARVNANIGRYAAWGGGKAGTSGRTPGKAYTDAVVSGLTAFNGAAATDYTSSWSAFWSDVVVKSGSDYAQAAQTAASTVSNPWYMWAVAAIVVGVVVLKVKR